MQAVAASPSLRLLTCSRCGATKPENKFKTDQFSETGRQSVCTACRREDRRFNLTSVDKICSCCGESKPRSEYLKSTRTKEGVSAVCRVCNTKRTKAAVLKRKGYYADKAKERWQRNYPKMRRRIMDRQRDRYFSDPIYRVRVLISRAINGWSSFEGIRTEEIVGCDFETFYYHLERTFVENYSILPDWDEFDMHIDHIVPVSSASTRDELIALNHFTNLQLLLATDNLSKSNRIEWEL